MPENKEAPRGFNRAFTVITVVKDIKKMVYHQGPTKVWQHANNLTTRKHTNKFQRIMGKSATKGCYM